MNSYLCLATSVCLGIIGQLLFKTGVLNQTAPRFLFANIYIFGGLGLYFISAIFYISSLRGIPVSVAYPSVAVSYFLLAPLAHFIFGEAFGIQQIIGLALIGTGIYTLYRPAA